MMIGNVPEDLEFRNVIKFIPDYPEEPHTEDEHAGGME